MQSDHDLLIRIDEKLEMALGRLNEFDKRISTLEKGYWKVVGGVGSIVLIGDVLIKFITR